MNDKEKFTQEVERRFLNLFKAANDGYKMPDIERNHLSGFIQAGVFMGLVTNAEMKQLMETVHYSVYGKSIKERKDRQQANWDDSDIDYSQYESPAYERN